MYKKLMELCLNKTRIYMNLMGNNYHELPPECFDGNYFNTELPRRFELMDIINWTSSFPIGMAYIAYAVTKDNEFLKWAEGAFDLYRKKVFDHPIATTMHDLGFLYIPYSLSAYKLTGSLAHREVGIKAADELAKRFIANGGYIRAWGRMDDDLSSVPESLKNDPFYTQGKGLTIIDCMMNLPLLYWAWEETKNPYYLEIAKKHSDTTIDNYFRKDGSVYHVFRFDTETGKPIGGNPLNRTPDEVYWARGHAWALYGFALGYAHTKEKRYLDAAIEISNKFIEYSDDKGLVCNNLIDIEKGNQSREVSASIIAACGFDLLDHEIFKNQCDKILNTIISGDFINVELKYPGILKSIDMPYTTWGDYYLMELLAKRLYSYKVPW